MRSLATLLRSNQLGALGAFITVGAMINALLPLVAKGQIAGLLGSVGAYNNFLNVTTVASCCALFASPFLLRGASSRWIVAIGFSLLAALNLCLAVTHLQWHPMAVRGMIGIVYGCTIPMGQFTLSQVDLVENLRIRQFTLMLNLVGVGVAALPFLGAEILQQFGRPEALFVAIALVSVFVACSGFCWLPKVGRVQPLAPAGLWLKGRRLRTGIGDALTILVGRGSYAFLLVWLSHVVTDYRLYQLMCLFLSLPYLLGGFVSLPLTLRLPSRLSSLLCFWLPLFALSVALGLRNLGGIAFLLVCISLISIPMAFTPGQFVSQWSSPGNRQFANVITMALMTLPLSLGPMLYSTLVDLAAARPPLALWPPPATLGGLFLLVGLPVVVLLDWLWRKAMIPSLHSSGPERAA